MGVAILLVVGLGVDGASAQDHASDPGGDRSPVLVPIYDLAGAVADFGIDGWSVVSAPGPVGRSGLDPVRAASWPWAGLLYTIDDEVHDRLVGHPRSGLRQSVRDVGDFFEPLGLMGNTNGYYAGAAVLSYFAGQERLQLLFKELLYSHWIAGATRQGVGRLVGRGRPKNAPDASTFDPGQGRSFPSGHSSTIFQLAHVLSHHIGWTPASVALYSAAATVAFQRIDSEEHWPSDVWVGSVWGLAVAAVVIRVEEEGRLEDRGWVPPGTDIGLTPSEGGLALTVRVPVGR